MSSEMWPNGVPAFGKDMKKEFLLGQDGVHEDVAFCNHGSYGTTPKKIMDERVKLLTEIENYPDLWYRQNEEVMYDEALRRVAEFLGACPDDLAFVSNTTTGVNSVLRSFDLEPEDVFLCTSHIYSAVLNAADSVVTRANADILSIDIPNEIESEDQVVQLFEQTLQLKKSVKLAIIDHISSASAILYPLKKIAEVLHNHGILVLGDGAHGPGQADFRLEDLGVDFYVASLHKWCYAPKGTGILWVHPKHHDKIRPLVVSHNYNKSFKKEFYMQGTSDLTRYNVLPKSLDFYETIGGRAAIVAHAARLFDFAVPLLCDALGTKPKQIPDSMKAPYMRVIEFPDLSAADGVHPSHAHANDLTLELVSKYKTVSCLMHFNGRYWLRLSANVYNCEEDYVKLKDTLVKFIKDKTEKANLT